MIVNEIAIQATGQIKKMSFICGTTLLLCPIIGYIFLKILFLDANLVYWINLIMTIINVVIGLILIKEQIAPPGLGKYILSLIKTTIIFIGVLILGYYIQNRLLQFLPYTGNTIVQLTRLILLTLYAGILIGGMSYLIILNNSERQLLIDRTIGRFRNQ